jgi:hypothetical protein
MKSIKRQTEETFARLVRGIVADLEVELPVFAAKRYREDSSEAVEADNGDTLVKPALIVECSKTKVNADLEDPAVQDATLQLTLIRDSRTGSHETFDGLLGKVLEALVDLDPEEDINADTAEENYLIHGIEEPQEDTAYTEEDDVETVSLTVFCQQYFPPAVP